MPAVTQWSIYTEELTSAREYNHPYPTGEEPVLTVRWRHAESGRELRTEGTWDGGRRWLVRFTPDCPGTWEWQAESADAGLASAGGTLECVPSSEEERAANPNLRGHVRVSANRRYFEYADGTPCFILGDTNWAMNTRRCYLRDDGEGPFQVWLRDRRSKGFTAVAVELYEIEQPNEGGYPFPANTSWPGNGDYRQVNADFFRALDQRMQAIWEAGFVILAHPTWIGKQVAMAPEDAIWVHRYLLARYGAYNLIWSLSGEYQYAYTHLGHPWTRDDWDTLGNAVASFNVYGHPLSVHPSGRQALDDPAQWPEEAHQASSAGEFHDSPWLDHNWLQTGQSIDRLWRVTQRVEENYRREPAKPVLHAEGLYEQNHVEGASPRMVRWQAWAAYLNGAAGHVYGAGGVFQWYDPTDKSGTGRDRSNSQPWHSLSWREALAFPGSKQLRHVASFFASIPWHLLEPHRDWLRVRGVAPDVANLADPHLAAIPERLYVIYIPAGNSGKRIDVLHLGHAAYDAKWYDPTSGAYSPAADGPVRGRGREQAWTTPAIYRHGDYVLVLRAQG